MPIAPRRYNQAKVLLTLAGSTQAGRSHVIQSHDDAVPDHWGYQLLSEARRELQALGWTQQQQNAVVEQARRVMFG